MCEGCAGNCLTTSSLGKLKRSVCQCLWCKYSNHGCFQATNMSGEEICTIISWGQWDPAPAHDWSNFWLIPLKDMGVPSLPLLPPWWLKCRHGRQPSCAKQMRATLQGWPTNKKERTQALVTLESREAIPVQTFISEQNKHLSEVISILGSSQNTTKII